MDRVDKAHAFWELRMFGELNVYRVQLSSGRNPVWRQ